MCAELARLPAKLRAVLVLCVMEDRSNAEAARVLDVPRVTVDSRLFHAKARLKSGLVRRGIAPAAAALLSPAAVPGAPAAAARLAAYLADGSGGTAQQGSDRGAGRRAALQRRQQQRGATPASTPTTIR